MVTGVGFPVGPDRIAVKDVVPSIFTQDQLNNGFNGFPSSSPSPRYTVLEDFDLTSARTDELFEYSGNLIWTADASVSTAKVRVRLDDLANGAIPLLPGVAITQGTFRRLYISNDAQAGVTISIVIGTDLLRKVEIET